MIDKIKTALGTVGYVANDQLAAAVGLLLASRGGQSVAAMLLDGPPGAGKTALAKAVARILGVDYVYVQAHPGSGPEEFLYDVNIVNVLRGASGDSSAVKGADDVVQMGFLPTIFAASQRGMVVAFVDELDKASPKVDSLFLAALQEGEIVVQGVGCIKANLANLVLFFTKNQEREISEPLMRRCRREYLGFPSEDLEIQILTGGVKAGKLAEPIAVPATPPAPLPAAIAKVLTTNAALLRAKQEDIIKPPATQELMMAGADIFRLAEWRRLDLAAEVVGGWLAAYREDRQILRALVSPEKLGETIRVAVSASARDIQRRQVAAVSDEFVTVGR